MTINSDNNATNEMIFSTKSTGFSKLNEAMIGGMKVTTYAMLIHVSFFAVGVIPGVGIIVPFILWLGGRNAHPFIDLHGRSIANWYLSMLIYSVSLVLLLLVIKSVLFMVSAIFGVLLLGLCLFLGLSCSFFAIVAAIKAWHGETFSYPLTLQIV